MLLFYEHKLALYTPPKTGSTTLIETLCRQPYAGILCIGPIGAPGHFDHHSSVAPQSTLDWRKVAVVRHPLQRLVSLWGFFAMNALKVGHGVYQFSHFALDVAERKHPFYFYSWNQCEVLGAENNYELVKVESLSADLRRVGLLEHPVDLPRTNYFLSAFKSPDWRELVSPELKTALESWWRPDAERFGYDV
jgi:hypothetical protein